jgi:hypothetical protein
LIPNPHGAPTGRIHAMPCQPARIRLLSYTAVFRLPEPGIGISRKAGISSRRTTQTGITRIGTVMTYVKSSATEKPI